LTLKRPSSLSTRLQSIAAKAKLAKDRGLGGITFFDAQGDTSDWLIISAGAAAFGGGGTPDSTDAPPSPTDAAPSGSPSGAGGESAPLSAGAGPLRALRWL
jgi:hypothetical protein